MLASRNPDVVRVGDHDLNFRPSFAALVGVEQELGPLFCIVERAGAGQITMSEVVALFDHTSRESRAEHITREQIGDAVVSMGLARVTPALRRLLGQILQGGQ